MAYGVKSLHTAQPKEPNLCEGHDDIHHPHALGRTGNARAEFLITDTRHLSRIKLHAAQTEHRQHRNTQHDNTHTANPLAEAAPKENAVREDFYIVEDCSTKCGES